MELYDYILSDDCYKVRLFGALLGLKFTPRKVDIHPGREQDSAAFRATVNPLGRIPVLVDGVVTLREPQAILTYLALRYDPARTWLPEDPATGGIIAEWLSFAARDLAPLSALRLAEFTDGTLETDRTTARRQALAAMAILEDHLAAREIDGEHWVAVPHPTIADIALFPPATLAPDAGLALEDYPSIWRWIERVRNLPNFLVMPGVFPVFPDIAA